MTPGEEADTGEARNAAFLKIFCGDETRYYRLVERVTTIGRSRGNVLELPDKNMSRRHIVVERREDQNYQVSDANSSNGTLVNDERVISQLLQDGDWIEAGSTRMQFVYPGGEGRRPTASLRRVSGLEGSEVESARKTAELGVLVGQREDLRKLLAINKELNREHELRPLLERIIDSAVELMAAERGFLLLRDKGTLKIEIARGMAQHESASPENVVSRQICEDVIERNESVLTTNAVEDQTYGRFQSVVGLQIHSVLCVPFSIKNTVLGCLYLDNDKVAAFSELDVELLEAFSDQAAVAIDNARLIKAQRQKERLEAELNTAAEIQMSLLPRGAPEVEGLSVAGFMRPAKEVGGDYYDFLEYDDGDGQRELLMGIGDVSGKGVAAGMVAHTVRAYVRALGPLMSSTRDLIVSLGQLVASDLRDRSMFMSLLLLRWSPAKQALSWTSAGHEHLLIRRVATGEVDAVKSGGIVLGVNLDLSQFCVDHDLELAQGDAVLLYTDGITEALDPEGEQWELERLIASFGRHGEGAPRACIDGILAELATFTGDHTEQHDDITLVALRREAD